MKTNYIKSIITLCLILAQCLKGFSSIKSNHLYQIRDVNTIYQFTATVKNSQVELNWQTFEESNLSYFIIERSVNGIEWQELGGDKAKGNTLETTIYKFTDSIPLEGTQYYRLKQTDLNGNNTYSEVIYANVILEESSIILSPNPVTEYVIIHFLKTNTLTSKNVRLLSSMGHLLIDSGTIWGDEVRLCLSDQPSDIYYIEVNNGVTIKRMKIIKN